MANLFWKTKDGVKSLLAKPFKTEEEFEKLIFATPEILEDIFLIKRQVRGGNKSGFLRFSNTLFGLKQIQTQLNRFGLNVKINPTTLRSVGIIFKLG